MKSLEKAIADSEETRLYHEDYEWLHGQKRSEADSVVREELERGLRMNILKFAVACAKSVYHSHQAGYHRSEALLAVVDEMGVPRY